MERIITKRLLEWKNSTNRKPLIIRGARQVGKTYTITDFGAKYFDGVIHTVNFEMQSDWQKLFLLNLNAERILAELEILLNKPIVIGKDLLFFDEIQECPKAILSLRYFFEQIPDLHVIAAGSLLDFALQDISFPVGKVQLLNMYPMNFFEFLLANEKKMLADILNKNSHLVSETADNLVKLELRKYFYVGGMPECVKVYKETQSLLQVSHIQANIIDTFKLDFSKYAAKMDKNCLLSVLYAVSQKVGQQIKYTELAKDFSHNVIKKSLGLLEASKLFKKIKATSTLEFPIGVNVSEKKFKCLMLDIGLMGKMRGGVFTDEYLKNDTSSLFRGIMAEQFVGQELLSAGFDDLYYWARDAKNSAAEVDFVIQKNQEIIPIEVKNGPSGKLKSLHLLLENFNEIKHAFVFSEAVVGRVNEQKISFIPLYFLSCDN
ncbi:MAG: AAA family ATPase [Bacteroidales bacterium]|nr:AAA family ATPase [Bacteroidales bacterium]